MRVSYELQMQVKGRWTIDQVFAGEKKIEAIEEAKRLNGEAHVSAVKLICETYNEETNQSTEVVVFHTDRELGERRRAERNVAPAPAAASALVARVGDPKAKGASLTKMTMMAVGLLLTALVLVAVLMIQGEQIATWLQTS